MKFLSPLLLTMLILLSCASSSQMPVASDDVPDDYKLAWKLPVGDLQLAAISPSGQKILLPVRFDGYYLYDSKGRLIWHLSDRNAVFAQFSSDGKSALLGTEYPTVMGTQEVSLIDTDTLQRQWNYTLDRIDHASLSPDSVRAAMVGASRLSNGWQKRLVVMDQSGTVLLDQTLGGESDLATAPAISRDGRYVAVGTWSRSGRDQLLYFVDLLSGKRWNATVHDDVVYVAVSSNGIVAAAGPQGLHLFDQNGNSLWSAPLPRLFEYVESYPHLWVSDSGEYVAVAGGLFNDAHVMLFDESGKKLWDSQAPYSVQAFAVANDGSRFVVGDLNGTIHVLDRSGNVLSRRNLRSVVRSIALGGLGTMAAVGGENVMYVLDAGTNILWTHMEIGSSFPFNIQTSRDGKRIAVGYSSGETLGTAVINENGTIMLIGTISPTGIYGPTSISAISSDGQVLVAVNSTETGTEEQTVLAWYDVSTGHLIRNTPLDAGSVASSLSMSDDGSLVAVSGVVWGNYTFISAFDSQGRQLWKQVTNASELVGYYEFLHVHSNVAVSPDGLYVAAALREQSVRFGSVCGGRNGVVLYDRDGKEIWKYDAPRCVWNVAVSDEAQLVLAGSDSQLDAFDHEGRILWSRPANAPMVTISESGERFLAGSLDGALFLGNASGPYWETNTNGSIESVSMSDSGDFSAVIISRDQPDSGTSRLLQVLNSDGRLLGNYTYPRPADATSGGHVAISGNASCIVAALGSDGIFYFVKSQTQTQTMTATTSGNVPWSPDLRDMKTVAAILVVVALVFVGLSLVVMNRRSRTNARGATHQLFSSDQHRKP
jgi:WD40 repeat protein